MITAVQAQTIARELCTQSGAWLVRKGDVPGMGMIRALFDGLHSLGLQVPSGADFDRYSHAVGPFAVIADGLSPEELLEVVTHECEHVLQFWEGEYAKGSTVGNTLNGGAAFAWLYLVEPEARVRFEARAYRAGLELRHMLKLPLPSAADIAATLGRGYMLDAKHVAFAEQLMESALLSVEGGVYTTRAAVKIEAILKRHGVIA
jgi:hypothetical protein